MAVQTKVVRFFMAGAVAIALSGCVTVPDAIKGTSPTPQQDLVRVMNAPELYVGQEAVIITEKTLRELYGIDIKMIRVPGVRRRICVANPEC